MTKTLEKVFNKTTQYSKVLLTGLMLTAQLSMGGCSGSKSSNPSPASNVPKKPRILEMSSSGREPKRGMFIRMEATSDDADQFTLERKKAELPDNYFIKIEEIGALPKGEFTTWDWGSDSLKGLNMSTNYTYRVRAENENGNSEWSEESTQKTPGPLLTKILEYPLKDAFVDERIPDKNRGGSSLLSVGNLEGKSQEIYIQFPLDKVPEYALEITQAKLNMTHQGVSGPSDSIIADVGIFKSFGYWTESFITWNNKPSANNMITWYTEIPNNISNSNWDVTPYFQSYSPSTRETFLERLNEGFVLRQNPNSKGNAAYKAIEGTPSDRKYSILELVYSW